MSVRMLAIELYKAIKGVEELEAQGKKAPPVGEERDRLEQELRAARAERDRLRSMIDGAKE